MDIPLHDPSRILANLYAYQILPAEDSVAAHQANKRKGQSVAVLPCRFLSAQTVYCWFSFVNRYRKRSARLRWFANITTGTRPIVITVTITVIPCDLE